MHPHARLLIKQKGRRVFFDVYGEIPRRVERCQQYVCEQDTSGWRSGWWSGGVVDVRSVLSRGDGIHCTVYYYMALLGGFAYGRDLGFVGISVGGGEGSPIEVG